MASVVVQFQCSPQPAVISSPPGVSLLAVFINNSSLTKNWNTCFKSDESSQELEYECGISSVFVLKLRLFSIRTAFPSFSVAVDSWKLWQYFRVWSNVSIENPTFYWQNKILCVLRIISRPTKHKTSDNILFCSHQNQHWNILAENFSHGQFSYAPNFDKIKQLSEEWQH